MLFSQLSKNHPFTRIGRPNLVWVKTEPFKAYGNFVQNAATGRHFDKISDEEIVNPTVWFEPNQFSDVPLKYWEAIKEIDLARCIPKKPVQEELMIELCEWYLTSR